MKSRDLERVWGVLLSLGVLTALVLAAVVPPARFVVVAACTLGVVLAPRSSTLSWVAAAGLPVAIVLAWGAIVAAAPDTATADCGDLISPVALLRIVEAAIVGLAIVALASRLGVSARSLGLRRPRSSEVIVATLAIAVIPITSLYVGGALAESFFGPIQLELAEPAAIVPAVMLALANGTMEELAYRGALMSWLSRAGGPTLALVGQAIVFGAAHTGSDYVASAIPVVLLIVGAGLVAGLIVRRTGSLLLPIVVHICFDVPLYYAVACRLSPA